MKLKSFFTFIGYIFGVVGGIGCSIWLKNYELVVAVVLLGIIGFPAFKRAFNYLRSGE